MNPVDSALSAFSCVPCDERLLVVRALGFVADAEVLKGGLLVALLCALWMTGRGRDETRAIRGRIVMTVAGAFAALCVSRLLALALPFRARPFEVAGGEATLGQRALESWSAFPSDHAALFFALATGILLLCRRLGVLALLHAVVLVSLPRIYLGLHNPTDMLAGAAIGALCALAATRPGLARRAAAPVLAWSEGPRAPWFGALAFLLAFEIATLFDSVRSGARLLWPVLRAGVHAVPPRAGELIAALVVLGVSAAFAWRARVTATRQTSPGAR
jgi:membrane-associated phospholipid phosphatase